MAVFSSDEDFTGLEDKDRRVQLLGYICSVHSPAVVGRNNLLLFKFGISNGNKKLMCLIWGDFISKYESEVVLNRIVHIDGGVSKVSKYTSTLQSIGFLTMEVTIYKHTVLTFREMHQTVPASLSAAPPTLVDFKTINQCKGPIVINGFIKTKFKAAASYYSSSSYGCGSITDGTYKLTVNITNYCNSIDFEKGHAVSVSGVINDMTSSTVPVIKCKDSTCVTKRENVEPLSEEKVLHANSVYNKRTLIEDK